MSWHIGLEPRRSNDLDTAILIRHQDSGDNVTILKKGLSDACLGIACLVSLENFLDNLVGSGDLREWSVLLDLCTYHYYHLSQPRRVRVLFSGTEVNRE